MSNARNLANTIGNGVINSDGYIDVIDRIILDGSDGSSTDAGDNLLLDATAASTNEGVDFLYETGSDDASFVLSRPGIISQLGAAPAGTIMAFGGLGASPNGWFPCNGATYNRADYPLLFQAIGTTWGAGDGATTFAVPDLRAAFL